MLFGRLFNLQFLIMFISLRAVPTSGIRQDKGQLAGTSIASSSLSRSTSRSSTTQPKPTAAAALNSATSAARPSQTSSLLDLPAIPLPTGTPGLDLPAIPRPTGIAAQTLPNGLVTSADASGLNSGAIIGVSLASLVGFLILVTLLDILLLSNRVQDLFRRSPFGRPAENQDEKMPSIYPQANNITESSPPSDVNPYYQADIKHSRSLSMDSLSSRYSRSTWGWSGDERDADTKRLLRDTMIRKSADYSVYTVPVFEEDEDDVYDLEWLEEQREKRAPYSGGIRIGMGVQKRYTGSSFATFNLRELQEADLENGGQRPTTSRRNKTWFLHDPLERWKRGLHPLSGQRGHGLSRIGYYG